MVPKVAPPQKVVAAAPPPAAPPVVQAAATELPSPMAITPTPPSPPPPASQIVHVRASSVPEGLRMMDSVWVSGVLQVQRQSSAMGTSGYAIAAAQVERAVIVEVR